MAKESLTITDNRTGKQYEVPIDYGEYRDDGAYIRGTELRKIKAQRSDFGLMTYDPAFMNTASCRSAITYIDGDKGILRYRGYPIEQLAEKSNFLEVAYLLLYGELPDRGSSSTQWTHNITHHTFMHENIKKLMDGVPPRRAPDGHLRQHAWRRCRRSIPKPKTCSTADAA